MGKNLEAPYVPSRGADLTDRNFQVILAINRTGLKIAI